MSNRELTTNEAQATPGPWRIETKLGARYRIVSGDENSDGFADDVAVGGPLGSEVALANARLIAAAPTMLDALVGVHETLDSGLLCPFGYAFVRYGLDGSKRFDTLCQCNYHAAVRAIESAIAAARGAKP